MAEAAIALLKLLLGLAVFVVLGYLGRFYDKRIAGVLLTFPILNGIGILTGDDALAVADSIYAVVVFNGLVLFLAISCCNVLPPLPAASPHVKLAVRLLAWTAIWAVGAPLIILFRNWFPSVAGLLLIQLAITAVSITIFWLPPRDAPLRDTTGIRPDLRHHVHAIVALWSNPGGLLRIGLFVLSCALLLLAAQLYSSKWVGMVSALPLPGLFAVATLSVLEAKEDFDLMRDSVLLGPITVIAFNWLYAQTVTHLPADPAAHTVLGIAALLLLLLADAALIFWIVPRISVYLDRVRR